MAGFGGMDLVYDAKSCRTIGIPSCGPRPIPPNTVTAIEDADGDFDVVVVMAGYDEWWTTFPDSFDDAVDGGPRPRRGPRRVADLHRGRRLHRAGRRGAPTRRSCATTPRCARRSTSGAFPDVVLADWDAYSQSRPRLVQRGRHPPQHPGRVLLGGLHLAQGGRRSRAARARRRGAGGQIERPVPGPRRSAPRSPTPGRCTSSGPAHSLSPTGRRAPTRRRATGRRAPAAVDTSPPAITVAATSIADCSSRMLRGGGKYSSSSVTLDQLDAVARARGGRSRRRPAPRERTRRRSPRRHRRDQPGSSPPR